MATVDEAKKALAAQDPAQPMIKLMEANLKELGRALPNQLKPERITRIALTNIRLNPKLGQCTPASFLGALFTAAQLGIEPIAGRAYLIPFNNNRKKADGSWHKVLECQFVLGYKGVTELFYRHEKALMLNWGIVREGDEFEYELGTGAFLKHRPAKTLGKPLGYYAIAELRGGAKPFLYMSVEECMEHGRKHSKTYDKNKGEFFKDSPWATTPDAMCLKTVEIQLAKILPLSVELQRALEADETSREFRKGIENALDLPSNTNWTDASATPTDEPPPEVGGAAAEDIPFGK